MQQPRTLPSPVQRVVQLGPSMSLAGEFPALVHSRLDRAIPHNVHATRYERDVIQLMPSMMGVRVGRISLKARKTSLARGTAVGSFTSNA
jgi:hypothetical protein